jgi:hypothetical protein
MHSSFCFRNPPLPKKRSRVSCQGKVCVAGILGTHSLSLEVSLCEVGFLLFFTSSVYCDILGLSK